MHKLLTKLLRKRGVEIDEMTSEERATFDRWRKTLSKDEVQVSDLRQFLKSQIDSLEKKLDETLMETDVSDKKYLFLRARIVNYKTILKLIQQQKVTREQLEKHLKQLIKQPKNYAKGFREM